MKNLTTTLCLTVALLFGHAGVSWSFDPDRLQREESLRAMDAGGTIKQERAWKKLAKRGNMFAQAELGRLYGIGKVPIPKNLVYAYMWMSIAISNGYQERNANLWLKNFEYQMTPRQISEAKYLAQKFVPDNRSAKQKRRDLKVEQEYQERLTKCRFNNIEKITNSFTREIVEEECRRRIKK